MLPAMHALAIGFGLGFLVALQLGPMSLFLIRSTLHGGWTVGLAIAGGIALVDALYAAAGAAGAASLLSLHPLRTALTLAGALVLLALGLRSLRDARRARPSADPRTARTPRRAFFAALAGTAANPATIASWAAIFAAASTAATTPVLLVGGVAAGSLCWMTLLATGTAAGRRAAGPRTIRAADAIAGAGLVVFGCALAAGV
jgi:putative LysE/RhtB family amino acid efflux pump